MKSVLRSIILNSFGLWVTSQVITGLRINGGIDIVIFGGIAFTLMNMLVKPIISILTLPLTLLTMGLFSWVLNVALVYLLTVLVQQIEITAYTFPGINAAGITIPSIAFSTLTTTILIAFMLSFIANFFTWLFRK